MHIDVEGTDEYGNEAYGQLFSVIMSDIGKAVAIENVRIVLKPDVPMFIFSLRLRNAPDSMKLKDAASIRDENDDVHVTIADERYAPQILSQLWNRYGRGNIDQSTRFDITVHGGNASDIGEMEVSSEEEVLKELIGAVWRTMPEGIRARHSLINGNTVTILATEEIMTQEMKDEAEKVHNAMRDA